MRWIWVTATAALLSACGSRESGVTTDAKDAHGNKVVSALAIDADDFKANIEVPGLEFGGGQLDLNGIKLYPGSKVRGMHVRADDSDGRKRHEVSFNFVSPAAPDAVAKQLIEQAEKAGFAVARASTGDGGVTLTGSKRDADTDADRFRFVLAPSDAETAGTATLTGSSH